MKNWNTILTESLEKYQPYREVNLRNTNILQMKTYYFLIKNK